MPELPEVETVKKSLQELVLNKVIKEVVVNYDRIIQTDLGKFKNNLVNQRIIDIKRVGKYLLFILSDYILLSHLRMEGKYFLKHNTDEVSKHDHVLFNFTDNSSLRYNDTRKFGVMYLFDTTCVEDILELPPLNKLGFEPGSEKLTVDYLEEKMGKSSLPVKTLLLDQSIISGLGNIYADEVLFKSRLNPHTKGKELNHNDYKNIISASEEVIAKAIKLGGTTIKSFVNSHAATGLFQNELLVHTKKVCPICNREITKEFIGGRGSYYCKSCQKKKKITVAITGSIATGKSTVSKIITNMGYEIIDLDKIARNIYENKTVLSKMKVHFNEVFVDNVINRDLLGRLIFSNQEAKTLLNSITHPVILNEMKRQIDLSQKEIVFVDFPLLFEGDFKENFDYTILSYVPRDIQLKRLMLRDSISEEYANKKIDSQMDIEKKKSLADFVVDNSQELEYTKIRIEEIVNVLRGV